MNGTTIDVSAFEQVCYLIYCRVKKLRQIPFINLCQAINDLAEEHSMDIDTEYTFCLPDLVEFGGLAYPHEFFLYPEPYSDVSKDPKVRMLKPSFWRAIIREYRDQIIVDIEVARFANEISIIIGIAA